MMEAMKTKKYNKSYKHCYSYLSLQNDMIIKMRRLCNDSMNQSLCDVTVHVGREKQEFHIVSALFAIHSSQLKHRIITNKDKIITIKDITPNAFKFLRQYFYGLNPIISLNNVSDILYAANKFKINPLSMALQQYISEITNVNDLLLVLSSLHQRKMHDICEQIISSKLCENAFQVFQCDNFHILPTELVIGFLKTATFHSKQKMTEEQIFEKCIFWAKYNAETAKINGFKFRGSADDDDSKIPESEHWKIIIQPLLPYIRFPIMNGKYFANEVLELNILSSTDCTYIMQYLLTKKPNKSLKYSIAKRSFDFAFDVFYDIKHIKKKGLEIKTNECFNRLYGYGRSLYSGIHKFDIKCLCSDDGGKGSGIDGIGIMTDINPCKYENIWFDDIRIEKAFVWTQYGMLWKFMKANSTKIAGGISKWKSGDVISLEIDCDDKKILCYLNGIVVAEGNVDNEKHYFFAVAVRDNEAHCKLIRYQFHK